MVNGEFLAGMKQGAAYVNTARGTLVDEAALAGALTSGHLSAPRASTCSGRSRCAPTTRC